MENIIKVYKALNKLKNGVEYSHTGEINSENDFNKINWVTGINSEEIAITTNICPHSEITWTKFKAEMDKL
tara:strand:+ start:385 stop:597 length:213 start_codon:yes stop_codon:yes gene_type:complete